MSYNLEEIILPIILRARYTNTDIFISFFVYRIVVILLSATYVSLLLGLYVPSWEFEAPGNNSTLSIPFDVTITKTVYFRVCSLISLLLESLSIYHLDINYMVNLAVFLDLPILVGW